MGQLRQAKDGHWYEYRRTYGGRFYTVQHTRGRTNVMEPLCWALFIAVFGSATFLLVVSAVLKLSK